MEDLHADSKTVWGHLQGIKGITEAAIVRFSEEGGGKKGFHFFLVQYAPGEVILAKGTTSDYAALHVQGRIRVRDIVPDFHLAGRGCWDHPLARRLENVVLARSRELADPAATPRRGWLGWTTAPLALLYWRLPEIPLRILGLSERWLPTRVGEAWRTHLARVLHGRMPAVPRAERELSKPKEARATDDDEASRVEKIITVRDKQGQPLPAEQRFMGIPGTLWNQPRTVTLVADDDPGDLDAEGKPKPCVMLLIKRRVLVEEIAKKAPAFIQGQMQEFVDRALPDILARNRLFQNRLFAEDVRDWNRLLAALGGRDGGPARGWLQRVCGLIDRRTMRWLGRAGAAQLDGPEKNQIIDRLNQALTQRDLARADPWPAGLLGDESEASKLLSAKPAALNDAQVFRLNRLLLEAALPGVLDSRPVPSPLSREEFQDFTTRLAAAHQRKFGVVMQPIRLEMTRDKKKGTKEGKVFCSQGEDADSVFLILNGMVRISVDLPGGRTTINNIGADNCVGESAILDTGPEADLPKRTANVETICDTALLRLDRDILKSLCEGEYSALGEKLRRERALLAARDEQMRGGRLVPPSEPPLAIAEKLVLTRNLLLIDMNKCTRCDQCVRGCAEAHDLQPRFHRANPELRFGKWEVAGACLHCLDAPCQQACPVGAITLLADAAVQVHRDRCIGCSQCATECPFGVIDMYEPNSPLDAPNSKKNLVANKCDLCLTVDHDPPCVACCPYDAAKRVAPLEFFKELRTWANFADRP
jgi:Fe-S-cluster-containing hydrogenase component 2/CRP-like cAMP-binding protein